MDGAKRNPGIRSADNPGLRFAPSGLPRGHKAKSPSEEGLFAKPSEPYCGTKYNGVPSIPMAFSRECTGPICTTTE